MVKALIQQKMVEDILTSEESFEKYVIYNVTPVNQHETLGSLYASKVIGYAEYLRRHGKIFSDNQLKIINGCVKYVGDNYFFSEFKNGCMSKHMLEKDKKIRKLIISIVTNQERMQLFCAGELDLEGLSIEDFRAYCRSEYAWHQNGFFDYYLDSNLLFANEQIRKNIRFLKIFIEMNPQYSRKNLDFEINEELKQKVFADVSQELINKQNKTAQDQVELAYQVYNALNSYVSYDEKLHLKSQREIDELEEITELTNAMRKAPEKVTLEDSKVICKNWSQIYAKLLLELGIQAYTDNSSGHMTAIFIDNDYNVFQADATNAQPQNCFSDNHFRMPDIVRSKLGLHSVNFTRASLGECQKIVKEYYSNGKFYCHGAFPSREKFTLKGPKIRIKIPFSKDEIIMFNDFAQRSINDDPLRPNEEEIVIKMMRAMEAAHNTPEVFLKIGDSCDSVEEKIMQKVKIINRAILALKSRKHEDNLLNRAFIGNMCSLLIQNQNFDIIDRIYRLDKKGNVNIVPILYVDTNAVNERKKASRMDIVYIFTEQKGFVRATAPIIKELVKAGKLFFNYYIDPEGPIERNELVSDFFEEIDTYSAYEGLR